MIRTTQSSPVWNTTLNLDLSEPNGGNGSVNAAERATNVELASKIAATVNLIKSELPDIRADLKPWTNDRDTRELIDPESIDLGFHFPGRSRLWQVGS